MWQNSDTVESVEGQTNLSHGLRNVMYFFFVYVIRKIFSVSYFSQTRSFLFLQTSYQKSLFMRPIKLLRLLCPRNKSASIGFNTARMQSNYIGLLCLFVLANFKVRSCNLLYSSGELYLSRFSLILK